MFRTTYANRNYVQAYTIRQKKDCDKTIQLRQSLTSTMAQYFAKQTSKEDTVKSLTALRTKVVGLTS